MALPTDELELISKKLTFDPDYTRFRSVCKSWRSVAPKRPQLPWLIEYNQTDSIVKASFFNFYTFSFETNQFSVIPELSESPILASSKDMSTICIGYSHGWVALFSPRTASVTLSNPLTNCTIDLPTLQNAGNEYRVSLGLTSDPSDSLSNCFALIYSYWPERILYCKVRYGDWIEMPLPKFKYINIHICSYQGKLFIASGGDVYVCDFSQNPILYEIGSVNLYDDETIKFKSHKSYLVESGGNLLFVVVYDCSYFEEIDGHNYFKVFRVDSEGQSNRLVKVNSIGDKALFLSTGTTFSLTASMHPGCKENSIYLTWLTYADDDWQGTQNLRIYDFEGSSSNLIKYDSVPIDKDSTIDRDSRLCVWFAPNLLT